MWRGCPFSPTWMRSRLGFPIMKPNLFTSKKLMDTFFRVFWLHSYILIKRNQKHTIYLYRSHMEYSTFLIKANISFLYSTAEIISGFSQFQPFIIEMCNCQFIIYVLSVCNRRLKPFSHQSSLWLNSIKVLQSCSWRLLRKSFKKYILLSIFTRSQKI